MLAASKYGMIDGGSACIPTYNEQQIEFWPKKLFLNIPTDMLFLERGRIEIPDKSNVRIVSGLNPGCMGVWDRSATIIAETTVPLFKRDKHDYYNPGDDEASSNTQPYLEWKNINIDKRLVLDTGFEEVFAQVCLCDEALDCFTPENWHDLGSLTIEPVSTSGFFAPIGRGNVVGFGFDLFKTLRFAKFFAQGILRAAVSKGSSLHRIRLG
jgi:hypothetical protein